MAKKEMVPSPHKGSYFSLKLTNDLKDEDGYLLLYMVTFAVYISKNPDHYDAILKK